MTYSGVLSVILGVVLVVSITACAPLIEDAGDRERDTVTAEDIEARSGDATIADVLEGRVSGVRVSEMGGNLSITIRGHSSIQGDSTPLYIVDGQPISVDHTGTISGVNPRDVERIRVLKSADETAIYGSQGANGVIIIETVRPSDREDDEDDE